MVYIQDFARIPDRNFVAHDIVFRSYDSGDRIKALESASPLPLPRIGENVILGESRVTAGDSGAPKWDHQGGYPESDEMSYRVEAIEHEYAFIEPTEEMDRGYESGCGVVTDVFVVEEDPDLPI